MIEEIAPLPLNLDYHQNKKKIFLLVESDEEIMSSKEELRQNTFDQHTTKQQLLKTIDKGYSIYKFDQEKLIDSALKSNSYFLKENCTKIEI